MSDVEKNIGTHKPQFDGEWVPISQVYDLQMGKTPSRDIPEYWNNGEHDWVSIKDLGSYEKYVGKTSETISELGRVKSGIKSVPANTLLMSFKLSLGKTAITTKETYTNEAIMAFLDKGTYDVDIDYMWHQLQSKDWTVGTNTAVMGKTLNKKTLSATKIRVPSISEQKEIAKHLDVVQETLSLLSLELKTLDDLVKSRFVEMFGDPKSNPHGWDIGTIETIAANLDAKRVPITQSDREEGPYPYYGATGAVDSVSGYIFDERLLLVSEDGANLLARTYPIAFSIFGKTWVNNHAHVLKVQNEETQVFLEKLINMMDISEFITGSTQPKLTQKQLNQIPVMLPPMSLQRQFAEFVARVDKLGFDVQQQIEKLETLKQSLMQEYFG